MNELARCLKFQTVEADESIITYFDPPENFYIILEGTANIMVPNDEIANWDWAMAIYQALNKWKD